MSCPFDPQPVPGFDVASQKLGFFPLRKRIKMRQTGQELTACVFVEQRVDEAVPSIDHIDHQPPYFVVVQARHFRPGNHATRTADSDGGIVTERRRWRDARMKFLEHRIAEASQDQTFRYSPLKRGIRHKCADFLKSVHVAPRPPHYHTNQQRRHTLRAGR